MEILAVIVAIAVGYHIVFSQRRQAEMTRYLAIIANRTVKTEQILHDRFENDHRKLADLRMSDDVSAISTRLYDLHKTLRGDDRDKIDPNP